MHYSANHSPHDEWVYNSADIDRSKIVWARDIPGRDKTALLQYFSNRTIWVVEPDTAPLAVRPFNTPAPDSSATNCATRGTVNAIMHSARPSCATLMN